MSNVFKDYNVRIDDGYVLIEDLRRYKKPVFNKKKSEDLEIKAQDEFVKQEQKASEFVLLEAKNQATKIVNDANALSKTIHENALKKAKQEFDRAQREGYQEGVKDASALMQEQLKINVGELKEIINAIEQEKQSLILKYENDLKDLSFSIAKKLIDIELKKNDEAFLDLFKSAINHLNKQDTIKLRVSELDAEFVTSNKEILLEIAKGAKNIEISLIEDAPKGTCIVETDQCLIDSSAQTQLSKIKQTLDKNSEI